MITRRMCRIALGLIIGAVAAPGLSATQREASQRQVVISSVTCDRGSCRQPLELVNGRSVTIGLAGEGLDALASGMVADRSGRRIEDVTVELASLGRRSRTRNATMTRDVTVTAEGIAAALTGLELRFTTNARRTVTAPLDLSIAGSGPATRAAFDSRATLRLEMAAGQKATIQVLGSRLDRLLTDLRIESGGRPVRGVTAAVVSQSPEALVLEVAIDRLATLSLDGLYELVAYDGRYRLSVPVDFVTPPSTAQPDPVTVPVWVRVATPPLRMTGLRLPIEIETQVLRMTGLRLPIRVATQELHMTGIREEEP